MRTSIYVFNDTMRLIWIRTLTIVCPPDLIASPPPPPPSPPSPPSYLMVQQYYDPELRKSI